MSSIHSLLRAIVLHSGSVVSLTLYTYRSLVIVGSLMLGWEKISISLAISLSQALIVLGLEANAAGKKVFLGVIMALGASITYNVYQLCACSQPGSKSRGTFKRRLA